MKINEVDTTMPPMNQPNATQQTTAPTGTGTQPPSADPARAAQMQQRAAQERKKQLQNQIKQAQEQIKMQQEQLKGLQKQLASM